MRKTYFNSVLFHCVIWTVLYRNVIILHEQPLYAHMWDKILGLVHSKQIQKKYHCIWHYKECLFPSAISYSSHWSNKNNSIVVFIKTTPLWEEKVLIYSLHYSTDCSPVLLFSFFLKAAFFTKNFEVS